MVIAKIAKGAKALTKRVKASKSKRRLKRKSKIVGGVDPKYRKDPVYVKEKRAQAFLHKRATPEYERAWLGEVGPASRGLKKRNKRPTNPTYHVSGYLNKKNIRAEQAYKTGRFKPKKADLPFHSLKAKIWYKIQDKYGTTPSPLGNRILTPREIRQARRHSARIDRIFLENYRRPGAWYLRRPLDDKTRGEDLAIGASGAVVFGGIGGVALSRYHGKTLTGADLPKTKKKKGSKR
ncbi:uncharacterized protein METZ01_LOCUS45424 [marine metagenome]|uniref:Uncharacterized protein n=1 Tax=marine metagenome TaxID=408172 RepID=A0A381RL42_9ZZZZ